MEELISVQGLLPPSAAGPLAVAFPPAAAGGVPLAAAACWAAARAASSVTTAGERCGCVNVERQPFCLYMLPFHWTTSSGPACGLRTTERGESADAGGSGGGGGGGGGGGSGSRGRAGQGASKPCCPFDPAALGARGAGQTGSQLTDQRCRAQLPKPARHRASSPAKRNLLRRSCQCRWARQASGSVLDEPTLAAVLHHLPPGILLVSAESLFIVTETAQLIGSKIRFQAVQEALYSPAPRAHLANADERAGDERATCNALVR